MSRSPEELSLAMADVRDRLLAVIGEHEQAVHGGAMCPTERLSAIAYLCHSVGLKATAVDKLTPLIFDYDVRCVNNGGCAQHPQGGPPV